MGIKYKLLEVFRNVFSYFFKYSVLPEIFFEYFNYISYKNLCLKFQS